MNKQDSAIPITHGDTDAASAMLNYAFRNASTRALRDVRLEDIALSFAEFRHALGHQVGPFQPRVAPWLDATFGPEIAGDREERNHRFLEEALELVQANRCTAAEAHQLVDYVFGRPIGEPSQEVGGVMVTLAALCLASGLDMHEAAETELTRVWTKVEAIRAKQAAKPKHSPLAEEFTPATRETCAGEAMIYDVHLPSMTARFRIPPGLPFAAGMYRLQYLRSPTSEDAARWAHLATPPDNVEAGDH